MSVHNPVILLSFANPDQATGAALKSLKDEAKLIREHLISLSQDDLCDLDLLNNASPELIFDAVEDWNKSREIILIHFAGHADGKKLYLTSTDGKIHEAHANGMAKLFGGIESLQLVFLNACSTLDQVKLLFEQNVKAVIATSKPVPDGMAKDLADRFYKNLSNGHSLQKSFEQASKYIETTYDKQLAKPSPFRTILFREEGKEEEEDQSIPWGLYFHEDYKEVLDWTLPQQKRPKTTFGDRDLYTCDREELNSKFRDRFLANKRTKDKFQFYVIHGRESQYADGLFNRFVFEHIAVSADKKYFSKTIDQEAASDLASAQMNAISAFFSALDLSEQLYDPDFTKEIGNPKELARVAIQAIANSKIARNVDCIALMFNIYSTEWKDYNHELLQWVINDFCKSSHLPPEAPDFVLIANIVYQEEKKANFFQSLFSTSPTEKLRKLINNFQIIEPLPELPPVFKKDVKKWLKRMTKDPGKQDSFLVENKYFKDKGEKDKMSMKKVVIQLGKIINQLEEDNI